MGRDRGTRHEASGPITAQPAAAGGICQKAESVAIHSLLKFSTGPRLASCLNPSGANKVHRETRVKTVAFISGERTIKRTASQISEAVDAMLAGLPEEVAPHMAMVRLVRQLTALQPQRMRWIMEDAFVRDAFEAALAEIPATPGRRDV